MYFLLTTRCVPDISNAPEQLGVPAPSIMAPGAGIPHAIDVVVMRALSDVDDRYPTAAAMAQALAAALTQPEALLAAASFSEVAPPPAAIEGEAPPSVPLASISAASLVADAQVPLVAAPAAEEPDHILLPELSAGFSGAARQPAPRASLVISMCVGVVLGVAALAAFWHASAALGGGRLVAEQAMNSASPPATDAAIFRPPAPAPEPLSGPSLLPAAPPTPEYKPLTVQPKGPAKRRTDSRVAEVRSTIQRCKPPLPFSASTVTVGADPGGVTRILFSGREAQGDFGRCVGRVAARTKIATGERLSFKL